ncbi:hypothetical protein Taro_049571 [Colocasia esculenta]|uniref:PB1 domain-containing protein n=1 Tax=Colocasia esculenta TaxID=4460 RepID=A0A843XBC6_COLES|nr:hypothetical protein [Colocasia esculenta]
MDWIPGIFSYKDEAYVIHLHKGMTLDDIVSDVCNRWTLSAEKVELKYIIPEQCNSKMTMTSGEDVDRMIDMHAMLNSKTMNVEVHVPSSQDVLSIRPSSALSSGSINNVLASEVNSSQDGSKRSELWTLEQRDLVVKVVKFNERDHLQVLLRPSFDLNIG